MDKPKPKFVYCIQIGDKRLGLCGKNSGILWMYNNYTDAKSGELPACPKCLEIGGKNK